MQNLFHVVFIADSRKFPAIQYAVLPRAATTRAVYQKLPKAALL